MNRKFFLALPVLLLPQFASAQTLVSDTQTHSQLQQIYATQLSQYQTELQILQQLQTLNQKMTSNQTSVSIAEREALTAQIAKTAEDIKAANAAVTRNSSLVPATSN